MRTDRFLASLAAALLLSLGAAPLGGCSSSTDGSSSGTTDPGDDAGAVDDAASATPTWSTVYANYFGSGTPGHCSNAGCHANTRGGFKCGADKDTCYQGLVSAGLVSTSLKDKSKLASSSGVLVWFNTRGTMPDDNRKANAQAAADILAWLGSGAQND